MLLELTVQTTVHVSHADRNLTWECNMDDQNVKPGVDSLMFVMKIHTLQTYLGMQMIV